MHAVQELLDEVSLDARGRPLRFRRGGRVHAVTEHLDAWRFGGRWWLGELPRACFLVRTATLVAELHHEDAPGAVVHSVAVPALIDAVHRVNSIPNCSSTPFTRSARSEEKGISSDTCSKGAAALPGRWWLARVQD